MRQQRSQTPKGVSKQFMHWGVLVTLSFNRKGQQLHEKRSELARDSTSARVCLPKLKIFKSLLGADEWMKFYKCIRAMRVHGT